MILPTRPESSIQKDVMAHAWRRGLLAIKQGGGGPFGHVGWPDVLIVLPDKHCFWIEFKEPMKGVEAELQKERKASLTKLGHTVYLICDVATGKYVIDRELENCK